MILLKKNKFKIGVEVTSDVIKLIEKNTEKTVEKTTEKSTEKNAENSLEKGCSVPLRIIKLGL